MEKKIIIDFLNEHWDEFAALLSETEDVTAGAMLTEQFPADIYEFAKLLSKITAMHQMQVVDKQKGLLERAQQFRKTDSVSDSEGHSSIVMRNGLFVVRPQQHSEILDSSFKNLVDSVL